eukprot:tig00000691_g3172.t1
MRASRGGVAAPRSVEADLQILYSKRKLELQRTLLRARQGRVGSKDIPPPTYVPYVSPARVAGAQASRRQQRYLSADSDTSFEEHVDGSARRPVRKAGGLLSTTTTSPADPKEALPRTLDALDVDDCSDDDERRFQSLLAKHEMSLATVANNVSAQEESVAAKPPPSDKQTTPVIVRATALAPRAARTAAGDEDQEASKLATQGALLNTFDVSYISLATPSPSTRMTSLLAAVEVGGGGQGQREDLGSAVQRLLQQFSPAARPTASPAASRVVAFGEPSALEGSPSGAGAEESAASSLHAHAPGASVYEALGVSSLSAAALLGPEPESDAEPGAADAAARGGEAPQCAQECETESGGAAGAHPPAQPPTESPKGSDEEPGGPATLSPPGLGPAPDRARPLRSGAVDPLSRALPDPAASRRRRRLAAHSAGRAAPGHGGTPPGPSGAAAGTPPSPAAGDQDALRLERALEELRAERRRRVAAEEEARPRPTRAPARARLTPRPARRRPPLRGRTRRCGPSSPSFGRGSRSPAVQAVAAKLLAARRAVSELARQTGAEPAAAAGSSLGASCSPLALSGSPQATSPLSPASAGRTPETAVAPRFRPSASL